MLGRGLWSRLSMTVLLTAITIIPPSQSDEDDEWIDPFDMVNFDPGSGQMRKNKQVKQVEVEDPSKDAFKSSDIGSQDDGQPETSIPGDSLASSTGPQPVQPDSLAGDNQPSSSENPSAHQLPKLKGLQKHKMSANSSAHKTILRKHVKMLLDKWNSKAYSESGAVQMTVVLSDNDRDLLDVFAESGSGDVHDVGEVLHKMVIQVEAVTPHSYQGSLLESYVGNSLPTVIQILAVLALVSVVLWIETTLLISWRQKIIKLICLAFFISIPWTWYHMYKQEEAKQQSEMMKDVPEVCVRRHLSWYEMAVEVARSTFTMSEDQCVKYYEHMLVDPVWKVAPTEAVAVTFVRFFVSPAKHIGQALSEFVKGVFQHLPVTLWPIVLVCGMIILGLVLLLSFGYSIRLPFLLSIESSHAHSSRHQLQIMTNQQTQQQNQIEDLKSQLKKVEGEKLMLMQSGFTTLRGTHSEPSVGFMNVAQYHNPRLSISDQSVQSQDNMGMPMLTQGVQSVGIPLHKQGVQTGRAHGESMANVIPQPGEQTQACSQNITNTHSDNGEDREYFVRQNRICGEKELNAINKKMDASEESWSSDKILYDPKDMNNSPTDLSKKLASLEIQNDDVATKVDCSDTEVRDLIKDEEGLGESTVSRVEDIGVEGLTSDHTNLHPLASPAR